MNMCGIAGWIDWRGGIGTNNIISEMIGTLAHRGPDATEVHQSPFAQLGHSRLAVIDLEGGKQPMQRVVNDYTYTLVYNGELYNTESLRQHLQGKGYQFVTNSDTEVLLVSYIEWQEQCVEHLNGIFSFAIWCEEEKSLFLCRDRLGVKPLFYVERANEILFASEIKALLKHPAVEPQVDIDGLRGLFSLGPSRNPGETVYKDIQELKPATYMKVTLAKVESICYWLPQTKVHPYSLQETVEQLRELIWQAVERQLVSDVPLCTFLSGGIDSSAITAIAGNRYEQNGQKLHTYSIDYEGNDLFFKQNEFQVAQDDHYIDIMRKMMKTEHHKIVLSQQELADHLVTAMQLKDYPSMADIDSSLYLFCKEVKKDFTVALSGECADEIFGGYPWFFTITQQFPWIRSIKQREGLLKPLWREQLQLTSYLNESYEQALEGVLGDEREKLFYLNRNYFMQTLLERKDRMSMGCGLEVRVPFADHELVEYVWNIPWEIKTIGGYEKSILRKAVEGLVPDEILYRKKNPYPKTHHPAYTKAVTELLNECLQDRSSLLHELFDEQMMKELIQTAGSSFKEPWFGQLMNGPQLLAYFVQLHYWAKNYRVSFV